MRKQVILFYLQIMLIAFANAQTDVDALRYSTPSLQGTARNIAVGNTMGTIGAEISALGTNPAGIAKFSATEFTITPAISIAKSKSTILNTSTKDDKVKFQLSNLGIVIAGRNSNKSNAGKWNGLKFGFAINRLANYNNDFTFSGYNDKNSLLNAYYEKLNDRDYITDSTDAADKYPFDASIAYRLGLITIDSLGNTFTATNNGHMQQTYNIQKTGGMDELALGIASMYKDKLMLGASIGIPFISYTERIRLEEKDVNDSAYNLNSFLNASYLKTRGVGFNLKVGIIGSPIPNLRLSLAIQTPSIIFMKDAFLTQMEVDYANQSVIYTGESPEGASKYKYVQPWKLTTGAGYIHKYGFVSMEYELSDAGNSKFKFSDASANQYERFVNANIDNKYALFHTIKAGIEFKYDPVRIRGGVQYRTSPFKKSAAPSNLSTDVLTFSAGIGYRGKHFFADLAYMQTNFKEMYVPYQLNTTAWNPVPAATLSTKNPLVVVTVGYKL